MLSGLISTINPRDLIILKLLPDFTTSDLLLLNGA
jgi:hypothetical protein